MKQRHYTAEFKKKEEKENLAALQHYGIDETSIRQLKNQKEQLNMAQRMIEIKNCEMTTLVTHGLVTDGTQS
jgi:hypothetical protein